MTLSLILSVSQESTLTTENETYFWIDTSLLRLSNRVYEFMNDTNYTLNFCAVRCESDGPKTCDFFFTLDQICYLGNWGRGSFNLVTFEFGFVTVLYRESK